MPKGRVAQTGWRAAGAHAAALLINLIIANAGAGVCGKALLLECGEQNAAAVEDKLSGSLSALATRSRWNAADPVILIVICLPRPLERRHVIDGQFQHLHGFCGQHTDYRDRHRPAQTRFNSCCRHVGRSLIGNTADASVAGEI